MSKYFKLKEIHKIPKPQKKGYKAILVEDKINQIGFYKFVKTPEILEQEFHKQELEKTTEKLIECFEYFLFKVANAKKINNLNDLIDLFKTEDFPYNLEEILNNRKDLKDKIISLEAEVKDE